MHCSYRAVPRPLPRGEASCQIAVTDVYGFNKIPIPEYEVGWFLSIFIRVFYLVVLVSEAPGQI